MSKLDSLSLPASVLDAAGIHPSSEPAPAVIVLEDDTEQASEPMTATEPAVCEPAPAVQAPIEAAPERTEPIPAAPAREPVTPTVSVSGGGGELQVGPEMDAVFDHVWTQVREQYAEDPDFLELTGEDRTAALHHLAVIVAGKENLHMQVGASSWNSRPFDRDLPAFTTPAAYRAFTRFVVLGLANREADYADPDLDQVDFDIDLDGSGSVRRNSIRWWPAAHAGVEPTCQVSAKPDPGLTLERLQEGGVLTEDMREFLIACVLAGRNIVVSGGTGDGKSTLLQALIPAMRYCTGDERLRLALVRHLDEITVPADSGIRLHPVDFRKGRGPDQPASLARAVRHVDQSRAHAAVFTEIQEPVTAEVMLVCENGTEAGTMWTMHTSDASEVCNKLVTFYPQLERTQALDVITRNVHVIVQLGTDAQSRRIVRQIAAVEPSTGRAVSAEVVLYEFDDATGAHARTEGRLPQSLREALTSTRAHTAAHRYNEANPEFEVDLDHLEVL